MPILDVNEIRQILPHRYPFLLVDRILELEPERIVGIKNVTVNEPFFNGHFPEFPVMPGVLIVEAMAQTAGVLVLKSIPDRESKLVLLVSIDAARFRRPVVPGDQLAHRDDGASAQRFGGEDGRPRDGRRPAGRRGRSHVQASGQNAAGGRGVRADAGSSDSDCRRRPRASHETADIGPYCIVGAEVEIGARTRLMANLYLEGPTTIGEDNVFFPYSTVGVASQDKKYKGERAFTRIGSRNTIREFVTIHRGTEGGGLLTQIGDDNLLMTYTHVAHDVNIGNGAVLGNA